MGFFPLKGEFGNLRESFDAMLLSSGSIQYSDYIDEHGVSYRTGAVLIDAPPETLRCILEDMERLGTLLKHIEYYRIRHESAEGTLWSKDRVFVEGRFAIPEFPAQVTLMMEHDRSGRWRKWRTLTPEETASFNKKGIQILPSGGLIKDMSGFEYLEPFDDGEKTVYYYAMNLSSTIPIPEYIGNVINDAVYTEQMTMIKMMAEAYVQKHEEEAKE